MMQVMLGMLPKAGEGTSGNEGNAWRGERGGKDLEREEKILGEDLGEKGLRRKRGEGSQQGKEKGEDFRGGKALGGERP